MEQNEERESREEAGKEAPTLPRCRRRDDACAAVAQRGGGGKEDICLILLHHIIDPTGEEE